MVRDTQRLELLRDRYVVLLREGHPFTRKRRTGAALLQALRELEFVNVRTHADTLRILQRLRVEDRLRLTAEHFMALPSIVRATDLAVVMPRNIARGFAEAGGFAIVEPPVAAARLRRVAALEPAVRGGCGEWVAAANDSRAVLRR